MNKKVNLENYQEFSNKEYLMGPNSLRLLEEMLRKYPLAAGDRVMDLGCGRGITSLFLAKEAEVSVFGYRVVPVYLEFRETFSRELIDDLLRLGVGGRHEGESGEYKRRD